MLIPFKEIVRKYGKPSGILHCGANIGEEAEAYHKEGIKNVSWIEANPELIPILRDNVFKYGHNIVEACLGDVDDEEVTFHISNNAGQSSSYLELGTHKIQHPEVHYVRDIPMETIRIESLFQRGFLPTANPPDFLNMDLQCAEMKALRGMGNTLHWFKWLYLEVNRAPLYEGCPHVNDLDLFLNGFGFKRAHTAPWVGDWSDALYLKKS